LQIYTLAPVDFVVTITDSNMELSQLVLLFLFLSLCGHCRGTTRHRGRADTDKYELSL